MFGAKFITLAAAWICKRKTGKQKRFCQDISKVLGTAPPAKYRNLLVQESKLYHGQFWTYFRMSVWQFVPRLLMLAPHLRRQSSNYVASATDRRYFATRCLFKIVFWFASPLSNSARLWETQINSHCCWWRCMRPFILHNRFDWLMCLFIEWKFRKIDRKN